MPIFFLNIVETVTFGAGSGAGGNGAAKRATVGGTKEGASGAGGNSGGT